jgi:hypothetical protein
MADHYGCATVPARPRSPTDRAPAETAVRIIERRIIAKLRHSGFFSPEEPGEAVRTEIDALNDRPFRKQPGGRRSVFLPAGRHELKRPPSARYEPARFKRAKAGFDYHAALDKARYYSVPCQFAGREALVRGAARTVEVFFEGERIACRIRSMNPGKRLIVCEGFNTPPFRA